MVICVNTNVQSKKSPFLSIAQKKIARLILQQLLNKTSVQGERRLGCIVLRKGIALKKQNTEIGE